MFCPVCGIDLKMVEVQEHEGFDLVRRSCQHCGVIWVLRHQGNSVVSITQEGTDVGTRDYGFDYKCPHCGTESTVYAVQYPKTGWKCINCGKIVPNECIKPRGDFRLMDPQVPMGTSRGRRKRERVSTYQRTSRTSKPILAGAVSLASVAERLKVEPKKLRSWLRKVSWRKAEEASSPWIFSPEEVEEIVKTFGR